MREICELRRSDRIIRNGLSRDAFVRRRTRKLDVIKCEDPGPCLTAQHACRHRLCGFISPSVVPTGLMNSDRTGYPGLAPRATLRRRSAAEDGAERRRVMWSENERWPPQAIQTSAVSDGPSGAAECSLGRKSQGTVGVREIFELQRSDRIIRNVSSRDALVRCRMRGFNSFN